MVSQMSRDARKPVFRISDQVQHKLAYTPTEESENLETLSICRGGTTIGIAKTKALCSNCKADPHLCFEIGKNLVFS